VKVAVAAPAKSGGELVTAEAVAEDAHDIVKPEDLDWRGEPKVKKPHLAMPGAGPAFGPPH
jgi:hypothetical protein